MIPTLRKFRKSYFTSKLSKNATALSETFSQIICTQRRIRSDNGGQNKLNGLVNYHNRLVNLKIVKP